MPGQGGAVERPYTSDEPAALGDAVATLSKSTADIYLSDRAYWRNVSTATWSYKLGGYPGPQEMAFLPREHRPRSAAPTGRVQHLANTGRRITTILLAMEK